jgi:alanine dehydrogenase
MLVGIPKEIKDHEYRVGLTPAGARALSAAGHQVIVQSNAGARIGFTDNAYIQAGAAIVSSAADAYAADMVIKVKEIQPNEWELLHEGQILFTYLHLAPEPALTRALLDKGVIGIAYETVTDADGGLPLLMPMSIIAGRLSIQMGAWALQMASGGNGTLLGGAPGVAPGRVLILGGGTVGTQAAKIAVGMGGDVTILDVNPGRLRYLDDLFGFHLKTGYSDAHTIETLALEADILVGGILIPGKLAPKIVTRKTIASMHPGSVFVDVAIDQGGCSETSRPTTHSEPTYVEESVVHYCVGNMPGAVARTSTLALTQVTLPYALQLANHGIGALKENAGLRNGLQIYRGKLTYQNVAHDLGLPYTPARTVLGIH